MADADLQIKFGADASALQSGLAGVKGALDGFASGLSSLKAVCDGFAGAIVGQASAVNQLTSVFKGASGEVSAALGVWGKFRETMDGLKEIEAGVNGLKAYASQINGYAADIEKLAGKFRLLPAAETAATAGMAEFDAAADANPLGALVLAAVAVGAAVAALIVWLKNLYDTNSSVKAGFDAVGGVIQGVGEVFGALWDAVVLVVKVFLDLYGDVAKLMGFDIQATIDEWRASFDIWKGVVQAVWGALMTVVDAIGAFLAKNFGPAIDVLTTAWTNARKAVSDVAGVVEGGLKSAFDWLGGALDGLVNKVGDLIAKNLPDVAAQWSKLLKDLAKSFGDVAAAVEQVWNALTNKKAPPAPHPSSQPPQSTQQPGKTSPHDAVGVHNGGHKGGGGHGGGGSGGGAKSDCAQAAADCEAKTLEAKIAGDRQKLAADQANTAAMDADYAQYLADLKARYGEDSEQYRQALAQKSQATTQFASGTIDIGQSLAGAFGDEFKLARPPFQSVLTAMVNDTKDAGKTIEQSARTTSNAMVSSFTSGLLKMAEGTQTFGQLVRGLGNQMAQNFLKTVVDPMISGWLRGIQAQITATIFGKAKVAAVNSAAAAQNAAIDKAGQKKSIAGDAAAAAGAAYKAMAGIPPAPLWGALAGAAAYAGVMAFEGLLPSAAGGWDIPAGINPLAQLHAQEMVLPARYANPMRDMLSSFSAMRSQGFSPANDRAGAGDTHLHLHMGAGADGPSLQRWFDQHGDKIAKSLGARTRRGVKFA